MKTAEGWGKEISALTYWQDHYENSELLALVKAIREEIAYWLEGGAKANEIFGDDTETNKRIIQSLRWHAQAIRELP
jgi:hypothetical protein